jgi:hypothetical protein
VGAVLVCVLPEPVVHASRLRDASGSYALQFIPAVKMLARMNETFDAIALHALEICDGRGSESVTTMTH